MSNREKIENLAREMKYLEEQRKRENDAIYSVLQQPHVIKYVSELTRQGYSPPDKWREAERVFGLTARRMEEERLSKEFDRLRKEKNALEKADEEEKERLEREAAALKKAEQEKKERLEREAAALKKVKAEKEEKERFERESANPVSKRFYEAILAFDKFVASFQNRLQQNDIKQKLCKTAFDDDNKAEKKRFDDEKNSIDEHLRRSIAVIDSNIEEKRRQLDRAIADIDRDVESYYDQGIVAIDNELKERKSLLNDRIRPLDSEISSLESSKKLTPEGILGRGCLGGCLGCGCLPPLIGGILALSPPAAWSYWWVGCIVGVFLAFAPYLFDAASKNEKVNTRKKLENDLYSYTSQKEHEKEEFIQEKYIPYKTKRESEKDEIRRNVATYEAARKRERDELPSKLKCEDKIRESKSQSDNRIQAIESEYQREQAKLKAQRKEILADFAKQSPDMVNPLTAICKEIQSTQPLLNELTQKHLNRTPSLPEFLALGQSQISFVLPEGFREKKWSRDVPHLLSFPFSKPLFGQYSAGSITKDKTNDDDYLSLPSSKPLSGQSSAGSAAKNNAVSDNYLIRDLLMRLLFAMPVGMLQITAIDPLRIGKTLDIFSPLLDIKKLVPAEKWLTLSEDIEKSLREHYDYIVDCLQRRFSTDITDWTQYNAVHPEEPLPYKVLFIFGFPAQFWDKSMTYLDTILKHGLQCGVLPIITVNEKQIDPLRQPAAAKIWDWLQDHAESIRLPYLLKLERLNMTADRSEPFVPLERVSEYMQWIHAEYEVIGKKEKQKQEAERLDKANEELRKKETALETEFWKEEDLWTEFSGKEISVPIGKNDDGEVVSFALDDLVPCCLLAGISGSGKSVLLHVIIQGLAHLYSPEELEFYLMDYKNGVEFNRYAKLQIPHTRLVVASKAEAEYGITVLEHLQNEVSKRYELFSAHDVSEFKGYREKGLSLPRVLLIIDEFQVLFQQNDAITKKVVDLLSDVAGRGRAAGVHLLLSTQSVRALLPVPGFSSVKEKLTSRIALASSRDDSEYILGTPGCGNTAAVELRQANTDNARYGILNTEGGHKEGNTRFLIPLPSREKCDKHQIYLAEKHAEMPTKTPKEVKIFDGTRLPQLPSLMKFKTACGNNKGLKIMLGEEFDVESKPLVIDWKQKRRKNLCIAGTDEAIRNGLLHSLLLSVDGHFERIIYFNANPHSEKLDLSIANLEVKNHKWNCDITDIVADLAEEEKKMLFIVDPLEEADEFLPPANYMPPKEGTPAYLFKQFLENAPIEGSYVVAFVENWQQFKKQFKDCLPLFELRIGFQLNANDAGDLTGNNQFKGLDNTRAVFADLSQNEQVTFRPFVVNKLKH